MPAEAHNWLLYCGYVFACAALAYGVLCAFATYAALPAARIADPRLPPATILKPLCGAEPDTYECLRSFCEQTYPQYQVVFGLSDAADPAAVVVRRLQKEFPALDLILSIDHRQPGNNRKVSNLIHMLACARHDYLVIADSDVMVDNDYLVGVVPPLLDDNVGIVTCCYRGIARAGLWSLLGAMYINAWFIPSVRVAALLGYRAFAFGATIAIRRDKLVRIGGFQSVANQLADDYRLGELTRKLGLRTILSTIEVGTAVQESTAAGLISHELRWRRTIRSLSPCGYAFSFITFGWPVAALQLLLSHGAPAAAVLFGATLLANAWVHLNVRRRTDSVWIWLLTPLRDLLHVALWVWSFATHRVHWRDHRFFVRSDGAAEPIEGLGQ